MQIKFAYDRVRHISSHSCREISSNRSPEHSVDTLLFYLQMASYSLYLKCCKLVRVSPLWPLRQRLTMLCSPTNKVYFLKEMSQRSLRTYFLQPVSCHWVFKLKHDIVQWCANGGRSITESRMSFGKLTESVSNVTSSCSEMELKTYTRRHTFCGTRDVPQTAPLASWAVLFRPLRSPAEHGAAGQGRQQQTLGGQPVYEPGSNYCNSFSDVDALAKWTTAGGLLSDFCTAGWGGESPSWGGRRSISGCTAIQPSAASPARQAQQLPSAWRAAGEDGPAAREPTLRAGCASDKQGHKQWQTI